MRVFACMASTLDGKLGPANVDKFVAVGSPNDMDHLKTLRDEADGIFFGASTFRTWPKVHLGHNPSRRPHHFILSNRLDFDLHSDLFVAVDVPLTIFSPRDEAAVQLPAHVNLVKTPTGPQQIPFILDYIKNLGLKALLVEGGGSILHQFVEAQVLEELFLTVVPKIIGQQNAPALFNNQTLSNPPEVKVIRSELVGDEVFLQLKFNYSS